MNGVDENAWNWFYMLHPNGGPWDTVDFSPDQHIIDFVKHYNIPIGSKILDSGCADGRNSKYLIEQGFEVTGIDISTEVTKRTSKRLPNGTFIASNVLKFNTEDVYDFIIDAGAMHVNNPSFYRQIIEKYNSLLSKNGIMFIRVFNNDKIDNIFNIDFNMPVFGMSEEDFLEFINGYFKVETKIFDKEYGAHGKGCNYFYLRKI